MRNNTVVPSRAEAYLFAGLAVLMGIHLCVRTALVPITYEEATRFFTLVAREGIPSDHFLSVLWAKFCLAVFGPNLILQRILSLAAYALFARYAFLLGGLVQDKLVRWCGWLALLIMPFAVELFGLAGGHSLAMAFLLMGLWHLSRIPTAVGFREVLWAGLAFGGVSLTTTAMLPAWAVGELAMLLAICRSGGSDLWKRIGLWSLLAIAAGAILFLGYSAVPGTVELSIAEILSKSIQLVFGVQGQWLVWTLVLSIVCMAWLAFGRMRSNTLATQGAVLRVCVALLVIWPIVHIALFEPRDLLHDLLPWLPIFFLGWAIALDEAVCRARHRRWLALLLLLPVSHMLLGIHVGTTRTSGDGAIPKHMLEEVQRIQSESDRPLVLGGGVRQAPAWDFGRLFDEHPLSTLQTDQFAREASDLLLLSRSDADDVSGSYRTIKQGHGGLTLMGRMASFTTGSVLDTVFAFPATDAEYQELPLPPIEGLYGRATSLDLVGVFKAERRPINGPFLVIEVNNVDMGHVYYASRPIDLLRGTSGKPIRITHALPAVPPDAQRVAIYIWNPARVPLSLDAAQLRILQRIIPEEQATE